MALILSDGIRLTPRHRTPTDLLLDAGTPFRLIQQQQDRLLARNLPVLFENQDHECLEGGCLRSDLGHRRAPRWTLDVYDEPDLIH